jgi:transposase
MEPLVPFPFASPKRPSYHPSVLLKLYIYGYLNWVQSSRRLEREACRNVEVMWLAGRLVPDHQTIADFRKDNGPAIRKVCAQFVAVCREIGLLTKASVAIGGSKFKAVNNRDKNFTRAKMERRLAQIEESVARYLGQLDTADLQEPTEALAAKTAHLKEKLAKLATERQRLKAIEKEMLASPDQQILTATGAARGSSQQPATAMCSAPMPMRADKLRRRVARHDERHHETGCRLAREGPHQHIGVVVSHMRHAGRAVRCNACTYGDLDRCARVDGDSLHPERPALRADALSIYGTVLPRHDSSSARVWGGHRPVRFLRVACARSRHSSRKQGHLVGDGARMGEVLLVHEAIMDS